MDLLSTLVVGLIAGWLASRFASAGGYGLIGDLVVGVLGAIVGWSLAARFLAIDGPGINATSITLAVAGTIVVLKLYRAVSRGVWRVYHIPGSSPGRRQTGTGATLDRLLRGSKPRVAVATSRTLGPGTHWRIVRNYEEAHRGR